MHYVISAPRPNSRYLEIELTLEQVNDDHLELYLPSWRPGRYETANFAKNIQRIHAFDTSGSSLLITKLSKDKWKVDCNDAETVIIKYNYYAAQPDAGACWIDSELIYINPVHCCIYAADRIHQPCKLQLNIPDNWEIASGLLKKKGNVLQATDYHQLVDSPLFASPVLHHNIYTAGDVNFHIWFAGNCRPEWEKIIPHFKSFSEVQIKMMEGFPVREYHF
ncbi:MAG: M61 family peptidase, partial [Bacteroidota bacterium]